MNRLLRTILLGAAVTLTPALTMTAQPNPPANPPATQPANATDVPVKVVVLFSSGVGYFEHDGTVRNDAAAELRFKTNQINDILKSLVLQDLDGGKVGVVTYPSQDPLAKMLQSFQVNISDNPPLGELLNRLRGARVTLAVGPETLTGTLLGLEQKQKPVADKGIVSVWVMNLLTGASIRAIELEQVRTIDIDNPELQDELHKALAALAGARDQDKKPVTIHFNGQGDRRVRLGYVVETPIWKTSYRLILPEAKDQKPKLQGWAIVENQTDSDWNNVELSLVSGRPISFIQDLYQPLYVPRPVVQPELYASLRPQTYEAGMEEKESLAELRAAGAPAAPAPAAMPQQLARRRAMSSGFGGVAAAADMAKSAPMDAAASVSSVASASKVGELFEYTVGNVTLPRQRSAMIPIITDDVEIERLSIYNQNVLPKNPLNGARLKNTTGKHLLQGPITVLDAGTYAGDARIDNVPPTQERLLSYGIDLQMLIDATKNKQENAILTGKIVKGILHLSRRLVSTQDYDAENKSEKDKTLLIEHPRREGWKLVDTDKPIETTDAMYRFKVNVPAGKAGKFTATEEIVTDETLAILPADFGQLVQYSRSGKIPKDVKDALAKAIQFKQQMADTQRQINEHQQKITQITQEQTRIRENMKTVSQNAQNSTYYTRLLTKLNDQESEIEKTQNETETLRQKYDQQRKELEDYLNNTTVG